MRLTHRLLIFEISVSELYREPVETCRLLFLGASARVFVRIMHEKPETAGAKMSALCSIHDNRILHLNSIVCVHYVAVSGEAVSSNNCRKLSVAK